MIPDIRTAVFITVLTNIVCTLFIILLWRQNRKYFEGISFWVFFSALVTLAPFLMVFRGGISDWYSIVLANTIVLAGALLGYMGFLRFVGKESPQIHNYLLIGFFAVMHAYWTFVQPDQAARNLNISVCLLIISFQCAWLLLYRVPAGIRFLTREAGMVFGLNCLLSIIRIIDFFMDDRKGIDFFQSAMFDALVMVSYQILFILLTYSLVLMVNKRLHMTIALQEEKFSKAFHSSPNAINLTRLSDGLILEANAGFLKVTGFQAADVIGKTVTDLYLWKNDEDRLRFVTALKNEGMAHDQEFQFRVKSGETLTGLFSAEIITINGEKCVLSTLTDITDRKKMEEALKNSNTYLEKLNNALADAVFAVKYPERVIEYLNDAAMRMFGYSKQEILGNSALMLYPDKEGYTRSGDIFQDAIFQKKNITRFETVLKRKNGETFPVLFTATFLEENDMFCKLILIVQDVTEQRRDNDMIRRLNAELEQRVAERTRDLSDAQLALLNLVDDLNLGAKELETANQSLEAVNKELTAFSYSVSHDLRAPLRSINGFSSALLEDYGSKLDEEGKNYLERIMRAAQNMGDLIDALLNLSRVTKSEFYCQDFDLSKMARDIADAHLQKNHLENFVVDIQDGVIVRADQPLINVAMTNLLDNAWKFSAKNSHPCIAFGADTLNGETVFFVRDNGVGFDMAQAGKIFAAFQRLHRTDEFPGTGIGLATVERIIHRHGGRIWVEAEPGKGAAFYFTLPVRNDESGCEV
jgi:PAS domain S-box-containing protein